MKVSGVNYQGNCNCTSSQISVVGRILITEPRFCVADVDKRIKCLSGDI